MAVESWRRDRDENSRFSQHGGGINDRMYCSLPQSRFIVREIYVKCIEGLRAFLFDRDNVDVAAPLFQHAIATADSTDLPRLPPVIESYRERRANFLPPRRCAGEETREPRSASMRAAMSRFDIPGPLRPDDNCIVQIVFLYLPTSLVFVD